MDSLLASTSPKSFRICQRGTEAGWGRVSSTGELYGRSRSHVVVERVAVAVMECNPHAFVEVVVWMRDREYAIIRAQEEQRMREQEAYQHSL